MSIFTQAIKLTYQSGRFGKKAEYNLQTRSIFKEKSHDQVDKIITQLHLLKGTPDVSFKFISIPEICKYIAMSNCNLLKHRCFRF